MHNVVQKLDRFQRQPIQVEKAQQLIEPYITPLSIEMVTLEQAYGRYLAQDVVTAYPLPHFSRSSMDGFSIRSEDLQQASVDSPILLKVIDNVPCGMVSQKTVISGTAVRTMTGAAISAGADAVVPLEMTEELLIDGCIHICISQPIPINSNILEIGSELAEGELILKRGCKICSGEIALLATYGYHQVSVYRPPVVAILSTGTELLGVKEPLQPGKIRNSNAPMLAALVQHAGGIPQFIGQIADDLSVAKEQIFTALETADVLISTGGVSVGDYDILTDFFGQWTGRMLFNKVAMRPGSPTTVGVLDKTLFFALSGNPGACFVGFQLFVRPALLGMQGCSEKYLPEQKAVLQEDLVKTDSFSHYVRSRMEVASDGCLYVKPVGLNRSNVLSSIKDSNCLIRIPSTAAKVAKGSLVSVFPLPNE